MQRVYCRNNRLQHIVQTMRNTQCYKNRKSNSMDRRSLILYHLILSITKNGAKVRKKYISNPHKDKTPRFSSIQNRGVSLSVQQSRIGFYGFFRNGQCITGIILFEYITRTIKHFLQTRTGGTTKVKPTMSFKSKFTGTFI